MLKKYILVFCALIVSFFLAIANVGDDHSELKSSSRAAMSTNLAISLHNYCSTVLGIVKGHAFIGLDPGSIKFRLMGAKVKFLNVPSKRCLYFWSTWSVGVVIIGIVSMSHVTVLLLKLSIIPNFPKTSWAMIVPYVSDGLDRPST
jgi:cell shape-determining protein MreD